MVIESSMRQIHNENNSQAAIQNERMYLEPEGQDSGEIIPQFSAFMMFFQDIIIREDKLERYYG